MECIFRYYIYVFRHFYNEDVAVMEYKMFSLSNMFSVDELVCVFSTPFFRNHHNPAERHDFWELIYAKQGALVIEDENKKRTVLNEGCVIFHKPMEYHQHIGNPDSDSEIFVFSFTCSSEYMKCFENLVLQLNADNTQLLHKIILSIRLSGIAVDTTTPENIRSRLKLYSELLLTGIWEQVNYENNIESHYQKKYNDIIYTLQQNIFKSLTVKDIAHLCNMSESNVKKIFHMYSDVGIMAYFNNLKLTEAKKMLLQGIPVGTVSSMLSFSSQNYFTVFFKSKTGMSPKQYVAAKS